MIIDFYDIKGLVKKKILKKLDHTYLNDILEFVPTAENLVIYIYNELFDDFNDLGLILKSVRLSETDTNIVEYFGVDV